jgi:hypothetical protein
MSHQTPEARQRRRREPEQAVTSTDVVFGSYKASKPGPVGLIEPDPLPTELTLQDREPMAQHQDLHILIAVAAREQW